MDIDELQTVQSKERQKDSLQHLRDSFYEDVAAYIDDLKDERDRVAAETDNPFSDPEVSQLTDDIERAEDVVEAIYERRVGKVVKMASFAAADMPVEEQGLTTQERDLFEDMVGRIGENRSRVLDIVAGEGDSPPTSSVSAPGAQPEPTEESSASESPSTDQPNAEPPADTETTPSHDEPAVGTSATDAEPARTEEEPPAPPEELRDEQGSSQPGESADPRSDGGVTADPSSTDAGPGAADTESATADAVDGDDVTDGVATSNDTTDGTAASNDATVEDDRTTVRVTEDVGRMLGVDDREYELKREDVVSLPEDNAEALLQREAAERLW